MRILVAYDGSVPADGTLYDLPAAGLPADAEALVLSASDPWVPYGLGGPGGDPSAEGWGAGATEAGDWARQALAETQAVAERGARYLRRAFPGWSVKAAAVLDDPAHAILERAEAWKPGLVVMGAPDRGALGRFLRGSVTQKVLHHCAADMRVGRARLTGRRRAPRLLLAVDGSAAADRALAKLAAREWPRGTEVRVVGVVDDAIAREVVREREPSLGLLPGRAGHGAMRRRTLAWMEQKMESACAALANAGLRAEPSLLAGEPRKALLEEAREWGATAIFVGSRGLNPVERFMLGSVSSAIAVHAPCTVEIVHSRRISARKRTERPAPKRNSMRQR